MAGKLIDKGHLLNDTDKLLTQTAQYKQRLDELKKGNGLVALAKGKGILTKQSDIDHAQKEWLGGPSEPAAWWPKIPDKEEILRQGFIKAYEIALQDPKDVKPIETYWIPGWDGFATVAAAGPGKKTTLLILTPPPPAGCFTGTIDRDMFVIASESTIESILAIYKIQAATRKTAAKKKAGAKKSGAKKVTGKKGPSRVRVLQLKGS